jgi:hypothetical protein
MLQYPTVWRRIELPNGLGTNARSERSLVFLGVGALPDALGINAI